VQIFRISSFPRIVLCIPAMAGFAAPQSRTPEPIVSGAYRVAGIVVSKIDSRPLSHARITLRDTKDSHKFQSIIAAEDGKFVFSGVPAGKYSLGGEKKGFVSAGYDQHDEFATAIVTGAGVDTEKLILLLAPFAVIAGTVLDEANEPVRHATVNLYHDDHSSGVERIHLSRGMQTNDVGNYDFASLVPGTYFLAVSAKPWYATHISSNSRQSEDSAGSSSTVDRSLDVAYPMTFYADVTDADSATPIPIRGGDHLMVDFHLTPVPAITIRFRVPRNGASWIAPQFTQPAFDGSTAVQTEETRASRGEIEISGIPAGRYNVRLLDAGHAAQVNGVDLTQDGQELDTSAAQPMSSVKVSVQIPGEKKLPPVLLVRLRSGNRSSAPTQMVDAKGEVNFRDVAAGAYEVIAFESSGRYSVAHMTADGAQVSGHALTVAAGSAASVSLTLVRGSVEVEGVVKKAGHPLAGAMVVLVPKDPESNQDLFRRDQSDLDGTFALREVVPGSYTLVAIENGWDLQWSQASVISAYLKDGREVLVTGESDRTIHLADAIESRSE
jgi:hypothetical protein